MTVASTECARHSITDRPIVVTGCAGFIGSWYTSLICEKYPNTPIVGYDLQSYCTSNKTIEFLNRYSNFRFERGGVEDTTKVSELLKESLPQSIVHIAAESHVDLSYEDPFKFVESNIKGTISLLQATAQLATEYPTTLPRFVLVSSDEVYGETCMQTEGEVTENGKLLPTNPYSASKASAEMFLHAYSTSYGLETVVIRLNNVYGPRQYPEKIIPAFLQKIIKNEKCYLHGSGKYKRRYLFVTDAAKAIELVRTDGEPTHTYNAGTKHELSNLKVLEILLALAGYDAHDRETREKFIGYTVDRPYNDRQYRIDSSKLHTLGWNPEVSLDEGFKQTYTFYKSKPDWFL